MTDADVVEIERNGSTQPALVADRYRLEANGIAQDRLTVITKDDHRDRLVEFDTAADRVEHVEGSEADLARSLLGDGLEVLA